jgi:hypothetical protein
MCNIKDEGRQGCKPVDLLGRPHLAGIDPFGGAQSRIGKVGDLNLRSSSWKSGTSATRCASYIPDEQYSPKRKGPNSRVCAQPRSPQGQVLQKSSVCKVELHCGSVPFSCSHMHFL